MGQFDDNYECISCRAYFADPCSPFCRYNELPDSGRPAKRSKKTCTFVEQIGSPHEGCAEFAPPVTVTCTAPATHRVKATVLAGFPDPAPTPLTELMCRAHASYLVRIDPQSRAYRFRR